MREFRPHPSATLPTARPTRASHPRLRSGRKLVRDVLDVWRLDVLAERAALIVTELIANAVRHTSCDEIRVVIGRPTPTAVRIGVVDHEPSRLPTLHQADDDDESGRGLLLIAAVSDRWGYDLHGSGRRPRAKEVWAELRLKSDELAPRSKEESS